MKVSREFYKFYENAKGGILLLSSTVISLILANSLLSSNYIQLWHIELGGLSLEKWINDGLMSIFFLLIGLELRREVFAGELSNPTHASLPIIAAIGGMLMPAAIFMLFNIGTPTIADAGVPIATDIAFAIGVISLLGKKVPAGLKGAKLVIAIFYTAHLSFWSLLTVFWLSGILLIFNKLKINSLSLYIIIGMAIWYFMLKSGVHATLSGILLALAIPFRKGKKTVLSYKLQDALDEPVALFILPVFALATTAIVFGPGWDTGLLTRASLGVTAGLIVGKPAGVLLFNYLAISLGICRLPHDLTWKQLVGLRFLAGIGFTMSIFITLLAYPDTGLIRGSKISILMASVTSGLMGFFWLKKILKQSPVLNKKINE